MSTAQTLVGYETFSSFLFNKPLGEELVLKLYREYISKSGLYEHENASTAPQNKHKPGTKTIEQIDAFDHRYISSRKIKVGSKKHILWLFFTTLTDRRQISDEVYRAHVRIFASYPELYTKEVLKRKPEEFGEFLAKYKIGVPRQSADYWIRCADTLFNQFDGDPIKLINYCGDTVADVQEYKKIIERETGTDPLPGYGPKITSLFLLFLAELNVYQMPEDAFPVDVHVQALFLQYNAMVTTSDIVNDKAEDFLRNFLCEIAKKHSLCKVALSHAFWIKGAKLCTGCSKRKSVHLLCSINKECLGRINTAKYFSSGIWDHPSVFMRKGNSSVFRIQDGPLFENLNG